MQSNKLCTPLWGLLLAATLLVSCIAPVAPAADAQSTTAAAPVAEVSETATRIYLTATGEAIEIPVAPQRIIALGEEWLLDDLLALDIRPIASTVNLPDAVPGVTAEELAGIELISSQEVSLEHLAELQPDLIIGNRYFIEEAGYDTLSQLAPTIALTSTLPLEAFLETATIFGLEAAAQTQVDAFRASVASAAAQFANSDRAVSVATIYPGAALAIWAAGPTSTPQLLLDLGFSLHPDAEQLGSAVAANGRAFVSLEELSLLDSELLILLQSSVVEGEDESVAEIQADPLWATLPAVQNRRVHVLDRLGYPGFRGQIRLLDDLLALLQE